MTHDPGSFGRVLWAAFAVSAGASLLLAVSVRRLFRHGKSPTDL